MRPASIAPAFVFDFRAADGVSNDRGPAPPPASTDAIKDLDPKRKCFRLIGGVLVERTVEEVLPAVEKNREGLTQIIAKMTEQRDAKIDKVEAMQKKYKIRVKGEPDPEEDENVGKGTGNQGILA